MKTPPVPFDSDALRANIATTAQAVVIPDRYQPLVDAVDGLYGVRASLVETVGEYFHAYRNADLLIEGFQTTLLRNWTHFEASDDRATLFGLLADLVLGLLDSALTPEQFSLSLRGLLMWCGSAVSGPHGDAYDDSLAAVAGALADLVDRQPAAFLERDALLRDLVERVAARPALAAGFFELYRAVLLRGYRRLEERLDVPSWATVQVTGLTDPAAVAERFDFLSGACLFDLIRGADEAPGEQLLAPGSRSSRRCSARRSTGCSASRRSKTGSPSASSS